MSGIPFAELYERGGWKGGAPETSSGAGSTLSYTRNIRDELPKLFADLGIKSIFDAGCGDFNWMSAVDLGGISYTGADVVEELIEANQRFATENVQFIHMDVTQEEIPYADLVLCRFLFIHLGFQAIGRVLEHARNSGARYLLAGSYPNVMNENLPCGNGWVARGGFRPVNLEAEPFAMPEPLRRIPDWTEGFQRHELCLWAL